MGFCLFVFCLLVNLFCFIFMVVFGGFGAAAATVILCFQSISLQIPGCGIAKAGVGLTLVLFLCTSSLPVSYIPGP